MEVARDRVSSPSLANEVRREVPTAKKKSKLVLSLALGEGVALEDMSTYAERDLIGHARGRNLSRGFLKKWVLSNWGTQLSTLSEVSKFDEGLVLIPYGF
jgi:hypothetical protein